MTQTIAIVATLDTKGREVEYLRQEVEALGSRCLVIDIGVMGEPGTRPDITNAQVADAGGTALTKLRRLPTRQVASPVMVAGATKLLLERLGRGELDGVIGLGGTQGTSNCCQVMQQLPYGLPKVMLSTVASGDTSTFVGIKDITMMFSVGDLLGLNPITRKMLANAAGAAHGMAMSRVKLDVRETGKPVIGMTNLGVLTQGAMRAIEGFQSAGYEVIVFHAVGSGGRAMEQMMKEGLITAVFDYALGEIADELFHGLRAGGAERLTVAGKLGLPQVICPGGLEHIGLLVEANQVPERWADHKLVFHNPVILAPRLDPDELRTVAREVCARLQSTRGRACFMMPAAGTSCYGAEGGPLRDPHGDLAFLEEIRAELPDTIELIVRDLHAESPAFIDEAVARLIAMMES